MQGEDSLGGISGSVRRTFSPTFCFRYHLNGQHKQKCELVHFWYTNAQKFNDHSTVTVPSPCSLHTFYVRRLQRLHDLYPHSLCTALPYKKSDVAWIQSKHIPCIPQPLQFLKNHTENHRQINHKVSGANVIQALYMYIAQGQGKITLAECNLSFCYFIPIDLFKHYVTQ